MSYVPYSQRGVVVDGDGLPVYSPPERRWIAPMKKYPIHKVVYNNQFSWNRCRVLYRLVFKGERLELSTTYPVEWRERESRDSGVSLVSSQSESTGIQESYKAKLRSLEDVINSGLKSTRLIMAALEVLDYLLAIGFIIAIIVDRGQQAIQLESFEILLVLSILLHAAGITIVRTERYTLSRELRTLAKEWSPAFNSLTMRGLGNNHANALAEEEDIEHEIEPVKDALRFDLRRVQGTFWLSYRPMILIEFIPRPSPSSSNPSPIYPPPRSSTSHSHASSNILHVPSPAYDPSSPPRLPHSPGHRRAPSISTLALSGNEGRRSSFESTRTSRTVTTTRRVPVPSVARVNVDVEQEQQHEEDAAHYL